MITIDTSGLPNLTYMVKYQYYRNMCLLSGTVPIEYDIYEQRKEKRRKINKKISESLKEYHKNLKL